MYEPTIHTNLRTLTIDIYLCAPPISDHLDSFDPRKLIFGLFLILSVNNNQDKFPINCHLNYLSGFLILLFLLLSTINELSTLQTVSFTKCKSECFIFLLKLFNDFQLLRLKNNILKHGLQDWLVCLCFSNLIFYHTAPFFLSTCW